MKLSSRRFILALFTVFGFAGFSESDVVEERVQYQIASQELEIINSTESRIYFRLSWDKSQWQNDSLDSGKNKIYPFGDHTSKYIKISTGKKFVLYSLGRQSRYRIKRNKSNKLIDLYDVTGQ